MSVAQTIDILARRGALDLFHALTNAPLGHRALVNARGQITESVWLQRLSELKAVDLVEEVRETGELRLSPKGRRLQGMLEQLDRL